MSSKPSERRPVAVLIAGAGPTGLVLALALARRGVAIRIVSDAVEPGRHSRAMIVQARTLEFYRQFGFADEVVAQGIKVEGARLREGGTRSGGAGRDLVAMRFADMGRGLSPFPFPLAYPQDDHERLLVEKLRHAGVEVEWNTRLTGFDQDEHGVSATTVRDNTTERIDADYLCGCDGARSVVRRTLGLEFPGGTYPQLYYVADVQIDGGPRRDLCANLGRDDFALLLPVRSSGMQRLIGLVPPERAQTEDPDFEALRAHVEALVDIRVTHVNWFSTYRVHHRVADRFQSGRAFVLGDAAHVHSPAGGQGMNTGIGDAINLGWKLAMVVDGRAPATLLATYEAERIGFARRLVASTDRAFTRMVAPGLPGRIARRFLIPLLMSGATRFARVRALLFRLISQIEIAYPDSALSGGRRGRVRGGDRLPWVADLSPDNFAPLASLDWQVHVYGNATAAVRDACAGLAVPLHRFDWTPGARAAGISKDSVLLLRPDGHVALACDPSDGDAIVDYARARGLDLA